MWEMKNIIKGKCVDISSEGKGVIKTVYGVIFVDALLLGEEAEIEITYAGKGVSFGVIKKLLSFSPDIDKVPGPVCIKLFRFVSSSSLSTKSILPVVFTSFNFIVLLILIVFILY